MISFSTIARLVLWLLPVWAAGTAAAQTWKSNAGSTAWNDPANWVEGVVPGAAGAVVVNTCAVCPQLGSDVAVNTLTVNAGGGIDLRNFTVTCATIHLSYATVVSTGGKITARHFQDVSKSLFTAPQNGGITLERTGASIVYWTGGNTFNIPLTLNMNVAGTEYNLFRTATKEPDTFNETVVFNQLVGALSIGFNLAGSSLFGPSIFKKKVTFYSKTSGGLGAVICEGEVEAIADLYAGINLGGSASAKMNAEFKGPVKVTLLGYSKGNQITFNDCFIHNQVVVNNVNQYTSWGPIQVNFGNANHTCTFGPSASLQIGSSGFYAGDLKLERCVFQTTALTNLDLVTTTPASYRNGRLIIGGGTVFAGPVQATAPHIFLNFSTYNQEATFIKTGAGANTSVGGNLFRRKLTITNRAGTTSPMNLANQYDDTVQQ